MGEVDVHTSNLKHVICVDKIGGYWHYWYVDRDGNKGADGPPNATLQKALSKAQGYARGIYEGTTPVEETNADPERDPRPESLEEIMEAVRKGLSAEDFDAGMRRNLHPKEYQDASNRKEFHKSPMEAWMAPKNWGFHVDGLPKIIVADDGYPDHWLDETSNNDRSRIVKMTIDDAVQEAKKSATVNATNDANMRWILFTLALVAIAITLCKAFY